MVEAVLFDLDETLTDRSASIARYAARFRQDFAHHLADTTVADLVSTFRALDERGYRPRPELHAGIATQLPWTSARTVSEIRDHWQTWFPPSAVGRPGLKETLAGLGALGLRLGVITNGSVRAQAAKIELLRLETFFSTIVISEAAGCEKPDPRIFARALGDLGTVAPTTWSGRCRRGDHGGGRDAGVPEAESALPAAEVARRVE